VRYSIDNVVENFELNVTATAVLFELCRKYDFAHIAAASSSSVYGTSSTAPFSEDQLCLQPISPYACTKRCCELLAYTFSHLYPDLPITMLRFFTVYGPRGRPDMACLKFIKKIENNEPIDKYGDGSAVREFTYIDDIVDGVVRA
jgi:UDP-glucuronate 4-epimerase